MSKHSEEKKNEPARTAAQTTQEDRDYRYKTKKEGFRHINEEFAGMLDTAKKLDNAAFRRLNEMYAKGKGQSKYEYKKTHNNKPPKDVIFSESTKRTYYMDFHTFISWGLNKGKLWEGMQLDDLIPFIQEFVNDKSKNCRSTTVHTYLAGVCKVLGQDMKDYDHSKRSRVEVNDNRSGLQNFSKIAEKYQEPVDFELATGLRKDKELGRVHGSDLQIEEDELSIFVNGKGGLERYSPVFGSSDERELVVRLCMEAGDGRVFPHLPRNLNLRDLRAFFASSVYLIFARDVSKLPREERYVCRADYKGIILDRKAMAITSWALRHRREDIISKSYIWPIVPYLRGDVQAEDLKQAEDVKQD